MIDKIADQEFLFLRDDMSTIGVMKLHKDGTVGKYWNFNENTWKVVGDEIQFFTGSGELATYFQSISNNYTLFMGFQGCHEPRTVGFNYCLGRFFLQKIAPLE